MEQTRAFLVYLSFLSSILSLMLARMVKTELNTHTHACTMKSLRWSGVVEFYFYDENVVAIKLLWNIIFFLNKIMKKKKIQNFLIFKRL